MGVLVDTNVISDVIHGDPQWAEWSKARLVEFDDGLFINALVYTELCCHAESADEVENLVVVLGLQYRELPRSSLYLAAKAHQTYRARGGVKTSPLPDFFIGAHAEAIGIPILTRDASRYRTYFPKVTLISP